MKRLAGLLAVLALPAAVHAQQLPPATPPGQLVFYGHIESLKPSGGRYLLRLDPATYAALERWAADELRSLNAQIEYLLRRALREAGRLPRPTSVPPEETSSS